VKKILRILGITILVLLVLAIVMPFFFKGKIIKKIKQEANKSLNAKVDFNNNVRLSLLKSFPDLNVRIRDISIVGINEFQHDTLASIQSAYMVLNLMSVFKGDSYEVKKVILDKPSLLLKVRKDGKVSWDIVKTPAPSTTHEPVANGTSAFKISVKKAEIGNGRIIYKDEEAGILVAILDVDLALSGDLTVDVTRLKIKGTLKDLTVQYQGIPYLHNAIAEIKSDIDADLVNYKYAFSETEIMINDIILGLDGFFAMPDKDIIMDLTFNTKKTDFKSFLSLVPALYAKDFTGISATGNVALNGFVKGIYNETTFPGFKLDIGVENGMFRYPSLPTAVSNIRIKANISNPGGVVDNTIISVSNMHFEIGSNPVDLQFVLKTPVSDPWIDANVKGKLNLSQVKEFYPLGNDRKAEGFITADFILKGFLSSIEKGEYEKFTAHGYITGENVSLNSPELPKSFLIYVLRMDLSPEYIQLVSFNSKLGDNDLSANGKIRNYLPYLLKGDTLSGDMTISSHLMNLNDILEGKGETKPAAQDTTSSLSVVAIPATIDFTLSSSFDKLVYGKIEMSNVRGMIRVYNSQVQLQQLVMNTLGGQLSVSGSYNAKNLHKPEISLQLNINGFQIQEAYNVLHTVQKFAPLAKTITGTFSTSLSLTTDLDSTMTPVYNTMTGQGQLTTSNIVIEKAKILKIIADTLKLEKLKTLALDKLNINYEFVNGKILVKPFTFKVGKTNVQISGSTSHNGLIDYVLHVKAHRSEFGNNFNAVLANLVGKAGKYGTEIPIGDSLYVDVIVGGTYNQPTFSLGLKENMSKLVDDLNRKASEELQKKKDELERKAREKSDSVLAKTQEQVSQIMQDAQKKADDIINLALQTSDKMTKDADINAANLIEEGKKNGPLGEITARKAADELKKETRKKADQVVQEARKQASNVLDDAKKKSDRIIQETQNKPK
jgi:uncharacterized protein involved in outer membrane biogenesis/ElaB/YqjD/DUF883 family membrane-anchored ribosome-binding protein